MSTQIFSEFIADLAKRRSLRRAVDGGQVTYRLQLSGSTVVTIVTDETQPDSTARVSSEAWPIPPDGARRVAFMREALNFNRNALHHLPCAIQQDPDASGCFRLIWHIPPIQHEPTLWRDQLLLFGKLAEKAWSVMASPVIETPRGPSLGEAGHTIFMP